MKSLAVAVGALPLVALLVGITFAAHRLGGWVCVLFVWGGSLLCFVGALLLSWGLS